MILESQTKPYYADIEKNIAWSQSKWLETVDTTDNSIPPQENVFPHLDPSLVVGPVLCKSRRRIDRLRENSANPGLEA